MALKGPGLRWLTASPLTSRQPRAGVTAGPRRGSWERCSGCGSCSCCAFLRVLCAPECASPPRLPARPLRVLPAPTCAPSPRPEPPLGANPPRKGKSSPPVSASVHRCRREPPRKQRGDAALLGEKNCLVYFNSQGPGLMAACPLAAREGRRRARRGGVLFKGFL